MSNMAPQNSKKYLKHRAKGIRARTKSLAAARDERWTRHSMTWGRIRRERPDDFLSFLEHPDGAFRNQFDQSLLSLNERRQDLANLVVQVICDRAGIACFDRFLDEGVSEVTWHQEIINDEGNVVGDSGPDDIRLSVARIRDARHLRDTLFHELSHIFHGIKSPLDPEHHGHGFHDVFDELKALFPNITIIDEGPKRPRR